MKTRSLWLLGMVFVLGLCLPFIATADGEVDNCCDYILANYMICDPDSYGSVCYCEGQKLGKEEWCHVNGCQEYEACNYGGPHHIYCCYPTQGGGGPQ